MIDTTALVTAVTQLSRRSSNATNTPMPIAAWLGVLADVRTKAFRT